MARAKKVKSVPKTTRTRRCKTTRKRTGAAAKPKDDIVNDDYEIIIPRELKPKKQSKLKKAAKVLFGLGGAAALGAAGYYGYKNRDKLKAKGKELAEKGEKYAADKYAAITDMAKKFYANKRLQAKGLVYDTTEAARNAFKAGRHKVYDALYNISPSLVPAPSIHARLPEYYPSYVDTKMNVISGLRKVLDDVKRTNKIDYDYLYLVLTEYRDQIMERDPFARNSIEQPIEDALNAGRNIDSNTEGDTALDAQKHKLELAIGALESLFNDITRH